MRVVEERYLKRNIEKMNIYALSQGDYAGFYENIETLDVKSLQDLSFKSDLNYFDKLPFIVGVISSIVNRPRISNRTDEVIMRAGLVSNFSPETFNNTMQDAKLWKQKGLEMKPEYVYSYQHEDEIKIYENIFIVTLIDIIDLEVKRYSEFYASLIKTFFGQKNVSLEDEVVSLMFKKLDELIHKLKRIKSTYFYRIIHKTCPPLKTVHPTNILVKERAYNICYKFYRSIITYQDKQESLVDLQTYYLALLLKCLKMRGFRLTKNDALACDAYGRFTLREQCFSSPQFSLTLASHPTKNGFVLTVKNNYAAQDSIDTTKHLLLISAEYDFSDVATEGANTDYDTVAAISPWNLVRLDASVQPIFDNLFDEEVLADCWLQTKCRHIQASERLYSTFCPLCRSRETEWADGRFVCGACNTQYTFYKDKEKNNCIWFLNVQDSFDMPLKTYAEKRVSELKKEKIFLWKIKQYLTIQKIKKIKRK